MGILDDRSQIFVGEDGSHHIRLPGGGSAPIVMERQEIHLEVVEAKGLPQMDVGAGVSKEDRAKGIGIAADPFVVVSLGEVSRKTDVVRDSLNPTFDYHATFILAEASDERAEIARKLSDMSEIKLRVEDWDEDGTPDFIGAPFSNSQNSRNASLPYTAPDALPRVRRRWDAAGVGAGEEGPDGEVPVR